MLNAFFQVVEYKDQEEVIDDHKKKQHTKQRAIVLEDFGETDEENDSTLYSMMNRKIYFDSAFYQKLKITNLALICEYMQNIFNAPSREHGIIKDLLSHNKLFSYLFDMISPDTLSILIESCQIVEVPENTMIINYGDQALNSLFLLSGEIVLLIPREGENLLQIKQFFGNDVNRSSPTKPEKRQPSSQVPNAREMILLLPPTPYAKQQGNEKEQEVLKKLEADKIIPELVLKKLQPVQVCRFGTVLNEKCLFQPTLNSFSVFSKKACKILVMQKQIFDEIIGGQLTNEKQNRASFLLNFQFFKELSKNRKFEFSQQIKVQFYHKNEFVYLEGERPTQIYFVVNGEVELGKKFIKQNEGVFETVDQTQKKSKKLLMSQKSNREIFGQVQVFQNINRFTYAQCVSAKLELYEIDANDFIEFIKKDDSTYNQFKKSSAIIKRWRDQQFTNLTGLFKQQPFPLQREFSTLREAQNNMEEKIYGDFLRTPAQIFQSQGEAQQVKLGQVICLADMQVLNDKLWRPDQFYYDSLNSVEYNKKEFRRFQIVEVPKQIQQRLSNTNSFVNPLMTNPYRDHQSFGSGGQSESFQILPNYSISIQNPFLEKMDKYGKLITEMPIKGGGTIDTGPGENHKYKYMKNEQPQSEELKNQHFRRESANASVISDFQLTESQEFDKKFKSSSLSHIFPKKEINLLTEQSMLDTMQKTLDNSGMMNMQFKRLETDETQDNSVRFSYHHQTIAPQRSEKLKTEPTVVKEKSEKPSLNKIYEKILNGSRLKNAGRYDGIIKLNSKQKKRQIIMKMGNHYYENVFLPEEQRKISEVEDSNKLCFFQRGESEILKQKQLDVDQQMQLYQKLSLQKIFRGQYDNDSQNTTLDNKTIKYEESDSSQIFSKQTSLQGVCQRELINNIHQNAQQNIQNSMESIDPVFQVSKQLVYLKDPLGNRKIHFRKQVLNPHNKDIQTEFL